MRRTIATLAVLLAAAPDVLSVRAQQPGRGDSGCGSERPPFAANTQNQLKGDDLSSPITGKTLVALRTRTGPGAHKLRLRFTFRPDGSAQVQCENGGPEGRDWRPCPRFNPENPQAPDRDLGTWQIEADQLVFQRVRASAAGRDEGRFTLHQTDSVIAVRRLSGPGFCLPGVVTFE